LFHVVATSSTTWQSRLSDISKSNRQLFGMVPQERQHIRTTEGLSTSVEKSILNVGELVAHNED